MNLFETHYSRWTGNHTSIWVRRFHIANHGMRATLRGKIMKWLIGVSWSLSLGLCTFLFLISQILQPESLLSKVLPNFREGEEFMRNIFTWLDSNPDISISAIYNLSFFGYTWFLSFLSLVAVTKAIPHLLTQDLGSKSLIIYTSKAISKVDYMIGKFGAIFGVLGIMWILPCLVSWVFANAFAPEWKFFIYSWSALWHSMLFLIVTAIATSILAMAFSAISSNPRVTTGIWIAYWIVGGVFQVIATLSPKFLFWIKYLNLRYNITKIQQGIFNLDEYYNNLIEKLPMLERPLSQLNFLKPNISHSEEAMVWTAILCIASIILVFRKLDTE